MSNIRWVLAALALAACGGRSVADGAAGAGGDSAGGSGAFAGSSAGGASAGGASGSANTVCLNDGKPPASPVIFSFESNELLWIHQGCDIEYALSKVCKPTSVPIKTSSYCAQPCSVNNGCNACGACPDVAVQIGQAPTGENNVVTTWDGYTYTTDVSTTGCECYNREPARSGSYTLEITGYLTSDDAVMGRNGYPFNTTFQYPPPDGVVHVHLDFIGL